MYKRKTATAQELSAARRRASLSRKTFRGGRPKGCCKEPGGCRSRTVSIDPKDLLVLRQYADLRGKTIKGVFNLLAAVIVYGTKEGFPARPKFAPDGWSYRR